MGYKKTESIKDRLYIATVCNECAQIVEEYGIGIELDQFCMAEKMDGEESHKVKREIELLLGTESSACPGTENTPGKQLRRTLHAPFNELFPAAIDPKARELAIDRYNRGAELAIFYGADKIIVHSGYMPFVYFKEWHIAKSVEFWNEFMAGKPDDFKIVIENVLEDEPYMMAEMMGHITNPNIRLCLDVGHANCMSEVPVSEWLDVMAPYLGHLHIHNNDGSHDYHKPIDEGSINMERFLAEVQGKVSSDVTITIESLQGLSSMRWLVDKGYI